MRTRVHAHVGAAHERLSQVDGIERQLSLLQDQSVEKANALSGDDCAGHSGRRATLLYQTPYGDGTSCLRVWFGLVPAAAGASDEASQAPTQATARGHAPVPMTHPQQSNVSSIHGRSAQLGQGAGAVS